VIIADNPDDFASSVVHLLRNEELRNSVGIAARQYVENNFSGDLLAATIEETYREMSSSDPI